MRFKSLMQRKVYNLLFIVIIASACTGQAPIMPISQASEVDESKVVPATNTGRVAAIVTPVQMVKAFSLDARQTSTVTAINTEPLSEAALSEQERIGFPSSATALSPAKAITINEQTSTASVAGTIQLIEGSRTYALVDLTLTPLLDLKGQVNEMTSPSFITTVVLDEADASDLSHSASLSLDERELVGLPYNDVPLKVINEIAINEQSVSNPITLSGSIQVLKGNGIYLLLNLTMSPS